MEKEDCLYRKEDAVPDICALIDYYSNQWLNNPEQKSNVSFAIDGEWGCGKSFVLKMVEEKLKEEKINNGLEDRYVVFHYNCWEYDYYDEPLVAIVSMMIKQIKEELKALNNKFNEEALHKDKKYRKILTVFTALKGAGSIVLAGLDGIIEKQTGISIKNILEEFHVTEEEIKEINNNKEIVDNISDFDPLTSFNNALNLLREALNIMAEEKTIVFVVDELDRCLPEYAIKVLERLHHISEGVKNLITVIAVDKSRLLDSISNAFGYDKGEGFKDSERYMKKFVDFYYPLDKGVLNPIIIFENEKYRNYLNSFDNESIDESFVISYSNFCQFFYLLFNGLDMREQENLIKKSMMIHAIVKDKKYDISVLCTELILTECYSCYGIKKENLYSFLTDLEKDDNLKDFREVYHFFPNLSIAMMNEKNFFEIQQILVPFAWCLKFFSAYLNKQDSATNGFYVEISYIKENYNIDMEKNLRFLCKFYDKLTHLS